MLITKETADIEKILIDFLSFLNKNGYINDYDFVYETQIKKFIKQIKTNKMEKTLKNNETAQFGIGAVSGCFYLQSEKLPDNSGEYEVITNKGRVIKIKYKLFEDNGIWECEYGEHEINESVVAWRFLK